MSQDVLAKNMYVFTNIYASKLPFSSPQSNGFILTIYVLYYIILLYQILLYLFYYQDVFVCVHVWA